MRTRKYSKTRHPHKVFLVICEGESKETYIDMLRQHYKVPVTIKTKVSGNTISERLVRQYVKELDLNDGSFEIFYVYDADVEEVVERLYRLPGTLILSNPCIELWYLLHMQDWNKYISSDSILEKLRKSSGLWKSYIKGYLTEGQKNCLLSHSTEAISRAMTHKANSNPSSTMYKFLQILEGERPKKG